MSEQHRCALPGSIECAVPGGPGGRLRTSGMPNLHAQDLSPYAAERPGLFGGCCGHQVGVGLKSVVDDQGCGGQRRSRGGGQRQRVGATGQCHAPERRVSKPGRGEPGQRRAQPGYSTRSIHRCGSSISSGSGRVWAAVQTALKRAIPTRSTTWSTKALPRVY